MTAPLFSAIALTLFPEMFPGPLGQSLAGKALSNNLWSLGVINIRDFATDKHRTVDASPYGGGTGMVLKPDVVDSAIEAAKAMFKPSPLEGEGWVGGTLPDIITAGVPPLLTSPLKGGTEPLIIYPSPRGVVFNQKMAEELKNQELIIVCGRFEGLDQRVIDHHEMLEVSLGDFVLSGGEIAALAMLDVIVRLLPGVIGKEDATHQESFGSHEEFARLLEYPHYTRPPLWNGVEVPDVLLSGNHEQIHAWRLGQAKKITAARRPDLIKKD